MVRMIRIPFLLMAVALAVLAMVACRDVDEPPPMPVLDPDAPLDGGMDANIDGDIAGVFCRHTTLTIVT